MIDPEILLRDTRFMRTDAGNGEYFAHHYREKLLFNSRMKRWYEWKPSKSRWVELADETVQRRAIQVLRARLRNASRIEHDGLRLVEIDHCVDSESSFGLNAMIKMARGQDAVWDSGEDWDADPWVLGVENGILDLRTGTVRPITRQDKITKFANVRFDPLAKCPQFEKFVSEIFSGNAELVRFVQNFFGYGLTGVIKQHVLFILYGRGRNGKTTLLNVISNLMGDYATVLDPGILERKRDAIISDGLNLVGARLARAIEIKEDVQLNEQRVKSWTGGDKLRVRPHYARSFEFFPTHKLVVAFNHLPIIHDHTPAMEARLRLIPFDRNFESEGIADPDLELKLKGESSGILNWLLEGVRRWDTEGLPPPEVVQIRTTSYHFDSNPIKEFVESKCVTGTSCTVPAAALRGIYKEHCSEMDEKALPPDKFNRRLEEMGFRRDHNEKERFWQGVRLADGVVYLRPIGGPQPLG